MDQLYINDNYQYFLITDNRLKNNFQSHLELFRTRSSFFLERLFRSSKLEPKKKKEKFTKVVNRAVFNQFYCRLHICEVTMVTQTNN